MAALPEFLGLRGADVNRFEAQGVGDLAAGVHPAAQSRDRRGADVPEVFRGEVEPAEGRPAFRDAAAKDEGGRPEASGEGLGFEERRAEDFIEPAAAAFEDARKQAAPLRIENGNDARSAGRGVLGKGAKRGNGDNRRAGLPGGELGEDDGDAQPGEGPGADADGQQVDVPRGPACVGAGVADRRDEVAAVAKALVEAAFVEEPVGVGQGDAAAGTRGFDGQNAHEDPFAAPNGEHSNPPGRRRQASGVGVKREMVDLPRGRPILAFLRARP